MSPAATSGSGAGGGRTLVLGTALWGWGVERAQAMALLDRFAEAGGRLVDSAPNYPLSKRPEDFGLALRWIAEWLAAQGGAPLGVSVKLGATDNLGGPQASLSRSFLEVSQEILLGRFGPALAGLAVHWDNRDEPEAIAETLDVFRGFAAAGCAIGFSGVRHPELYAAAAPDLANRWHIQVKENAATCEARERYRPHFPAARYLAYGINMGGLKREPPGPASSLMLRGLAPPDRLAAQLCAFLESEHGLQPRPSSLNELALSLAWHNPSLAGVVAGPRSPAQLAETLAFWSRLETEAPAAPPPALAGLRDRLRRAGS